MESRTANRREPEPVDSTTLSPDFVDSSIHSIAGVRTGRKRVLKAAARSDKASRGHEILIPDDPDYEIDFSNNNTLLKQRGDLEEFEAEAIPTISEKLLAKRFKKKLAKVKAMAAISGASRDQVSTFPRINSSSGDEMTADLIEESDTEASIEDKSIEIEAEHLEQEHFLPKRNEATEATIIEKRIGRSWLRTTGKRKVRMR